MLIKFIFSIIKKTSYNMCFNLNKNNNICDIDDYTIILVLLTFFIANFILFLAKINI